MDTLASWPARARCAEGGCRPLVFVWHRRLPVGVPGRWSRLTAYANIRSHARVRLYGHGARCRSPVDRARPASRDGPTRGRDELLPVGRGPVPVARPIHGHARPVGAFSCGRLRVSFRDRSPVSVFERRTTVGLKVPVCGAFAIAVASVGKSLGKSGCGCCPSTSPPTIVRGRGAGGRSWGGVARTRRHRWTARGLFAAHRLESGGRRVR
jgi:hypothetical protein